MLESLFSFILAAHGTLSTVYGYGEKMCGINGAEVKCERGVITASGEMFDPDIASAALAVPNNIIMRPGWVVMRLESGPCKPIKLNDRKHERYSHSEARFDLTPAAVIVLGGKPSPTWSGRIYLCFPAKLPSGLYDWQPKLAVKND